MGSGTNNFRFSNQVNSWCSVVVISMTFKITHWNAVCTQITLIKSAKLSQCGTGWGRHHNSHRITSITVIMGHQESCPGRPLHFVMARKWTQAFTHENKHSPWGGGCTTEAQFLRQSMQILHSRAFEVVRPSLLCPEPPNALTSQTPRLHARTLFYTTPSVYGERAQRYLYSNRVVKDAD